MTRPAHPKRRRTLTGAAPWCALVAVLALAGCAAPDTDAGPTSVSPPPPVVAQAPTATPDPPPEATSIAVGVDPARVEIARMELDEPLIGLGLDEAGEMEVPSDYDDVGWYTGGGKPGGHGPLIIVGHVDSPTGGAVFMRLSELIEGDRVTVTDVDGVRHEYEVVEVADYDKAAFPTVRVYGATAADELRLITCGGDFRPTGSYPENRVVYAVRA